MRKLIPNIVILIVINLIAVTNILAADLNIDPTYLKLKIYKFAVSTSVFCTNPVTIFETDAPTYMDILQNPTFGSGQVADGTYNCVIIEFADIIKFLPNATSDSTHCNSSTEATLDVCRSGSSKMSDGTTTTCTVGEDRVAMYLSTTSATSGGGADAFPPPTTTNDATKGFLLGNALVVSGTGSGKFVVNGTDQICDTADGSCNGQDSTSCELMPPAFSFSKL